MVLKDGIGKKVSYILQSLNFTHKCLMYTLFTNMYGTVIYF